MVVINRDTGKVYECSRKDASKIIGISTSTLYRWEKEQHLKSKLFNNYLAIFDKVTRVKQKKGFALTKRKRKII